MTRTRNPRPTSTTTPDPAPVASTPDPADTADTSTTSPAPVVTDPTADVVAILTGADPTPDAVAAVLRGLTGPRRRDVLAAAPAAIIATGNPDHLANLATLVGILTSGADMASGPAPVAPLTVDQIATSLAHLVNLAMGPLAPCQPVGDPPGPRTPLGRFLAAAVAAVGADPDTDTAAHLARILGRTPGRATTSQAGGPRTRTDRSAGRDLANLAGVTLTGPNGATAVIDPSGAVAVTLADGTTADAASLTAAANLASGPGASVNGWLGWRASDGRTADAVARGVVASQ